MVLNDSTIFGSIGEHDDLRRNDRVAGDENRLGKVWTSSRFDTVRANSQIQRNEVG